jgi:hypothetical protein
MDTAQLAHRARLSLAKALEAMQAPQAGDSLLGVAAPLAKAMNLCVQLEAGGSAAHSVDVQGLLGHIREALERLQLPENQAHSALVATATAAVAEALGAVHELSRVPKPPAPSSSTAAAPPSEVKPPEPSGDVLRVEAALGAHSPSNFYKGLSGNDVVSAGGIFIATYQVPALGQRLQIKVSLPGGYEFEAQGVVAWRREADMSTTASGASPGFGARLTQVSAEGQRLIERYSKNREPWFYDA